MRLKNRFTKIATTLGVSAGLLMGGLFVASPAQANTWIPWNVNWYYSYDTCASHGKSLMKTQPDLNAWLCQKGTVAGKWTLFVEQIDDFGCRIALSPETKLDKKSGAVSPAGC